MRFNEPQPLDTKELFLFFQSSRTIDEHPKQETITDEEEYVMTELYLYPADATVYQTPNEYKRVMTNLLKRTL